jgi:hypothetical protein
LGLLHPIRVVGAARKARGCVRAAMKDNLDDGRRGGQSAGHAGLQGGLIWLVWRYLPGTRAGPRTRAIRGASRSIGVRRRVAG